METTVQDTDTKGEGKAKEVSKEIDLKSMFSPPESNESTDEKGEDEKKPPSPGESEDLDSKELQAKVDALTKELSRVRKGKTEFSDEAQELREQLASVKGQLEVLSKGQSPETEGEGRLVKYTDEQLLQGQTEWEDALYEERNAMRQARTDNDDPAYNKASRGAATAKSTLVSIRKELLERTKRVASKEAQARSEADELVQDIAGLYENTYKVIPDLKDKDSEIWKAGNDIYNRHAKLMKQLGPMAELVATALAITENPKLLPGAGGTKEVKEARKELLSEINAQGEKSFIKGKGTTGKKVSTDFGAMPKAEFEKLIHTLKMGG